MHNEPLPIPEWRTAAVEAGRFRMPFATAKWYATELASLMLGAGDHELLTVARGIDSRVMLLDWCERCSEAIGSRSDRERAHRFRDQVHAALARRERHMAQAEESSMP
jgi:hypothetical protein